MHDVLKWAAYTYSTAPDTVPTSAAYDPASIPEPASSGAQPPLSTAELNQLLATFEAKEAALAEAKETSAALQAELEKARAEVATAQVGTLRQRLWKVGAVVCVQSRRIVFHLSATWPGRALWGRVQASVSAFVLRLRERLDRRP